MIDPLLLTIASIITAVVVLSFIDKRPGDDDPFLW